MEYINKIQSGRNINKVAALSMQQIQKYHFFKHSTTMKKRVFLVLALCMCLILPALAQSKITGTIIEETNGKGIPFVNVGLFRQTDSVFVSGAASDDKGKFELLAPNGDYRLQVSAIGFQTFEQEYPRRRRPRVPRPYRSSLK